MHRWLVSAVVFCGLFGSACSPSTTGSGAGPAGGSTTDGGATAASALSCSGIISCAGKCADDKACEDKCLAEGSPAARDAVNGLLACADQHSCADSACFQQSCGTELQSCLASASGSGEALTGAAPSGSVPADLVGRWGSGDTIFEFAADGTASLYTELKTGSCKTTSLEKGTAVTDGANLTLYLTSRVYSVCDAPGGEPYAPKSIPYTFRVDPATPTLMPILRLKELNCRYSDPAAADMYCATGYDKQ